MQRSFIKHLDKLPFVVVILYGALMNATRFNAAVARPASLAAGAALLALLHVIKRSGREVSPIAGVFVVYFALNAAAYWLFPETLGALLSRVFPTVIFALLFAASFFPAVIAGRYFTEHFAKKTAPQAVWSSAPFKEINRTMTLAWSGIFLGAALVSLVPVFLGEGPPSRARAAIDIAFKAVLPLALILGVGVPFTKSYPKKRLKSLGIDPAFALGGSPGPMEEKEMETKYKVVALNGSPHGSIGSTSMMIGMIAGELGKEGIEVEEIDVASADIGYCAGCGFCLERGRCWKKDDHAQIMEKALAADGVILASPVYFMHVTAQMKAFIDRALAFGHKPRAGWKPGLAVSVSAGKGETLTANYLAGVLRAFGAFSVGTLTALATSPGGFMGAELVEARAKDLARDLARAIREKRRYPATDEDLNFFLFMGDLIRRERDFMKDDDAHWEKAGLHNSFETYVGQKFSRPSVDPEVRKEWMKSLMRGDGVKKPQPAAQGPRALPATCRELLESMPRGFNPEAAAGMKAVIQFNVTGDEEFSAHLAIGEGRCVFSPGEHPAPDLAITTPAGVWLSIARGETDGQKAFMSGAFSAKGDFSLMMRMKEVFSRRPQ